MATHFLQNKLIEGGLTIQDIFSAILPMGLISYSFVGLIIFLIDIFLIPLLLRTVADKYSSLSVKAGYSILIIILVLAPLYSFYQGYRGTILYEIWPVDFIGFIFGGLILAALGMIYLMMEDLGHKF